MPPPPPPPDEDMTVHAMPEKKFGTDDFAFKAREKRARPSAPPATKGARQSAATSEHAGPIPVPTECPASTPLPAPTAKVDATPTAPPAAATAMASPAELSPGASTPAPVSSCLPPKEFAARVCERGAPSAALTMFAKGSPWRRAYVGGYCEAWNVAEGDTANDQLEGGEEVLILRTGVSRRKGISDGGANVLAMRWNGNCVMLHESQVTDEPYEAASTSQIEWNWLSGALHDTLRKDAKINAAYKVRLKACKSCSGFGKQTTPECADASAKLTAAISGYVRAGGTLPAPDSLP